MDDSRLPGELILRLLEFSDSPALICRIELLCRQCFHLVRANDHAIFRPLVLAKLPHRPSKGTAAAGKASTAYPTAVRVSGESWRDLLRLEALWSQLKEDVLEAPHVEEAFAITSSLLPPPPAGCAWGDRELHRSINTVGSTSSIFRLPIKVEGMVNANDTDELTDENSTLAVAHFLQDPPQSGVGEILAVSLNDIRPGLTKVVALDVLSYGPLVDEIVRPTTSRIPYRRWEDLSYFIDIVDNNLHRVASIEGPSGIQALRRMRSPGLGTICGDHYALLCGMTGTLQLWYIGDQGGKPTRLTEADIRKLTKRRLRWIKGDFGEDIFVDNPALNENMVAARKMSSVIHVFWLDGTEYDTVNLKKLPDLFYPSATVRGLVQVP
ncbi:hypothetical protein HDU96_000042 [Phlyctochytrium bullatum]|nr:hypothetical protein HDU96_000042 [Phlyctochytrium bullatum]